MHAASTRIASSISGHLIHFNLSPKGVPEGMLVRVPDQRAVQVNFDPEMAGPVTAAVSEGDLVAVQAVPFADAHPDAHPVYSLTQLTTAAGGNPVVADGPGEADAVVRGTVVRLNHARRGEVNGGILDTGDFVHLKPHGVKAIGGLTVGQMLEARGEVRPGWSGHRVIEARTANGTDIGKPPHENRGGPPKHKPHGPKHEAAAH